MKRADISTYKLTEGLVEHMERTGEKPPAKWFHQPADMVRHGGYGVRKLGKVIAGPFAWAENARREADRLGGGVMCRYTTAKVVRETPEEKRAARRAKEGPAEPVKIEGFLRRKLYQAHAGEEEHSAVVARLRRHPLALAPGELARALGRAG